jgi:hypothetical protein
MAFLRVHIMSALPQKAELPRRITAWPHEPLKLARSTVTVGECKRFANGLWRSVPSGYDQKMTSQNVHANAKRLVKASIDRAKLDAPDGRINQVAAQTGLKENEIGPAIKYAKAQGWFQPTKIGNLKRGGWLSVTPAGKAAVES